MGSISPDFSAVPRGIYCPTITFFQNDGTEDIDLKAQAEHARFLIQSGVHGITIHGTTGESVLLSHAERNAITKTIAAVRRELNASTTLVVGCSAQSVREIVRMCEDAKAHGGQYALVLPPSYWAAASTPAMIENFYKMVSRICRPSSTREFILTCSRSQIDHPYRLSFTRFPPSPKALI